ncbi:hypothetical protein [Pseudonocardia sp. NPDC049154]|uniref:hypothetical protein n=1 Tax=Pseudonocardia sp. NPDC049154 TaxID=3155501 RepID=UPI0033E94B75
MSEPIERVRFVQGQLLRPEDFRAEQDYHRRMRWLHNRLLHGTGVVTGLEVGLSDDRTEVQVSPGLAIDEWGRELLSDEIARIAVGGIEAPASDAPLWVVVRWVEEATAPAVPTPGSGGEFTRIRECALVEVQNAAPSGEAPALVLAALTREAGRITGIDVSGRSILP